MPESSDLAEAAASFAEETRQLLEGVLPGEHPVYALRRADRYVVQPGNSLEPAPVPLRIAGAFTSRMEMWFHCTLDSVGRFLAVERSSFALYVQPDRTPLVRLDFQRDAYRAPRCHWQFHGERGSFTKLLAHTGKQAPHDLSKLHLPVGGSRMRPSIEDFVQFLVQECGVDARPDWQRAVADGRARWRKLQIAALVRDAPELAAAVLQEAHGYAVVPPAAGHPSSKESTFTAW